MSLSVWYAFLSVAVVSVASFVGIAVFTLRQAVVSKILQYLVSFSTGAVLGTVFLHLIPESMEHAGDPLIGSALILAGMLLAFAVEKFIHWHHCHRTEHDDEGGHHNHPLGALILIGDGIHNFIDGMLIAAAYAVSVPVGLAATVAILLHEIPQELGDISLLLHSGFTRSSALLWNFLSACTALVGAGVAIGFESHVEGLQFILLPIAAGNFLYIAATDLIPELHKETRLEKSLVQAVLLLAGIGLMAWMALNVSHEGAEDAIRERQESLNAASASSSSHDSVHVNVRIP